MPIDLAKRLGANGITEILSIMWLAYTDLRDSGIISKADREDKITEEWYIRLSWRWNSENRASRICLRLTPILQHEDDTMALKKGKPPTIDFCFRAWEASEGYFGAECKNLYDHDDKHIQRYVATGVNHYISGRYGSCSTTSAMIGYVLSGKLDEIADELKTEICTTSPRVNLLKDMMSKDAQYKTQHIRTLDNMIITLYHLFFNFAA
jgi:hypothetical protein